jgi:hypothetical protein
MENIMTTLISSEKVEGYKVQIVTNWNKSQECIIEVGRLLADAKKNLSKDEWKELENDLPFCKRTANRLMSVGNDMRITSGTHASKLPNSWATLYEISTMSEDEFDDAITTGVLTSKVQRKEVTKFLNEKRGKVQPKVEVSPTEHPETLQFAIVYINPDNLTNSDALENFQESIQKAIDGVANVRVDFSESQERIYSKWDREQARDMKMFEKEAEKKAKKRLSQLIKEGIKISGGRKKFEYGACSSIQELREMPVDDAINLLGDDQTMFRDTGKSISTTDQKLSSRAA